MTGKRRRRSAEEVRQLVAAFEASEMTRAEFGRARGLAVTTLDSYRRRLRQAGASRLLPVEWQRSGTSGVGAGALSVVLGNGRRVEMGWDFDDTALGRLVAVLERG